MGLFLIFILLAGLLVYIGLGNAMESGEHIDHSGNVINCTKHVWVLDKNKQMYCRECKKRPGG